MKLNHSQYHHSLLFSCPFYLKEFFCHLIIDLISDYITVFLVANKSTFFLRKVNRKVGNLYLLKNHRTQQKCLFCFLYILLIHKCFSTNLHLLFILLFHIVKTFLIKFYHLSLLC